MLLSAGVGAMPVLAILDSLVSEGTSREVWWLHAARCRAEHAFAADARVFVARLAHGHLHVRYSRPAPDDALGRDYDAPGHLSPTWWPSSTSRARRTSSSAARPSS